MRKYFLPLVVLILVSTAVEAQYTCIPSIQIPGNPGGAEMADYPDVDWSGGYLSDLQPAWFPVQPIPFPFYFNGSLVSSFKVSNSGLVVFDTSITNAPPFIRFNLPDSTLPSNSIYIGGIITSEEISLPVNNQLWIFLQSAYDTGQALSTIWSVVLEGGTNNVYLVNSNNAQNFNGPFSPGIQINSDTAIVPPGSPDIYMPGGHLSYYSSDNYYYAFVLGNNLLSDGSVISSSMPIYVVKKSAPFIIKADFKNLGADTITNLTLHYNIRNTGVSASETYTGLSIPTGYTQWFTFSSAWTPPSSGTYTLDIYADNLSSGPDEDTANDHYIQTIYVADTLPPRKIMFEELKGDWCISSGYWTYNYDTLLAANSAKLCSIKYEEDDFGWQDVYSARAQLYQQYSVPTAYGNGAVLYYPDSTYFYNDYLGNPWNIAQQRIDSLSKLSGLFYIQPNLYSYGNVIQGNVAVASAFNIPSTVSCRVFCAIIEDSIFRPNANYASGETLFVNTTRILLPSAGGVFIGNPASGTSDSINFVYLVTDTTCNVSRLHLVAFVQDMNTLQILQSGEAPIIPYNLAKPMIPLIVGDPIYCPGSYTTLQVYNVSPGSSYYWNNGDTGVAIKVSSTGYYTVTATNNYGTVVSTDSFYVAVSGPPAHPLITGDTFVCQQANSHLGISNYCIGCNYYWEINSNIDPESYHQAGSAYYDGYYADSVANYTVVVTNQCGVDSALLGITHEWPAVTNPIISGGYTACAGHPATLYIKNPCVGCTYLWNDSIVADTFVIATPGDCKVVASNYCGTQYFVQINTLSGAPQPLTITGDSVACNKDAQITVNNISPGCTLIWNADTLSKNASSYYTLGISKAGYSYVQAVNVCGASGVDSFFVYGQPDTPTLSYNSTYCQGQYDTITITNFTPQYTYTWPYNAIPDGVADQRLIDQYNYYWVDVYNPLCYSESASSEAIVTEIYLPDIPVIEGVSSLCGKSNMISIFNTQSGVSYLWSTDSTSTYTYITTAGVYYVSATNQCGTVTSTPWQVSPPQPDNITITGPDTICAGIPTKLVATGACPYCNYRWNTDAIGDSISITDSGTFYVTATNTCATAADTITVTAVAQPNLPLITASSLIFSGNPITLSVNNPCSSCSYTWNNNITGDSTTINTRGNYWVTANNRCGSKTSQVVNIASQDSTSIDAGICQGDTFMFGTTPLTKTGTYTDSLTAQGGGDSIVIVQLTVFPTDSTILNASICPGTTYSFFGANELTGGNYSYTLQNVHGCDSVVTVNLIVLPPDTSSMSAAICPGDSFSFFGSMEASPGNYVDTIQNINGCYSVVTLHLTVYPAATPPVLTAIDTTICPGDSTVILSSGYYSSYLWNTGATTPGIHADTSGSYYVQVTDTNGCKTVSDSVIILEHPVTAVSFTWDSLIEAQWLYSDPTVLDCIDETPQIPLAGGTPSGGIYTGTGVSGDTLYGYAAIYFAVDTITYTVTSNGCTVSASNILFVTVCSGITEVKSENDVLIYPNPSTGTWHLEAGGDLLGSALQIFDEQGRLVFQSQIRNLQSEITLDIAAGIYYLRIFSPNANLIRKLVKL